VKLLVLELIHWLMSGSLFCHVPLSSKTSFARIFWRNFAMPLYRIACNSRDLMLLLSFHDTLGMLEWILYWGQSSCIWVLSNKEYQLRTRPSHAIMKDLARATSSPPAEFTAAS
jgi:hypothetical protein